MKRLCFLLGLLLMAASCSQLPKVQPAVGTALLKNSSDCRRLFPQGRWQFQHAITAVFPGERKSLLMGVSIVSAESGSIRSILMTVEGLVVFDAEYDREIRVLRALPPFDSEPFSLEMIHDLRLIFFMPEGDPDETGTLQSGSILCRYRPPDRPVVDIIRLSDDHWQLQRYNRLFRKERTVDIFFTDNFRYNGHHIPGRMKLTAWGYAGYTLDLDLIEAVLLKEHP